MRLVDVLQVHVEANRINQVVRRQRFRSVKNSDPEKYAHSMRAGRVGDWRMAFAPTQARRFNRFMGDYLIDSGYAPNGDWIDEVKDGSLQESLHG